MAVGLELLRAASVASSGVPVLQIASPIIMVAITLVSEIYKRHVEKDKKETDELKALVAKYDDIRQVRGEQREFLIRALGTIEQTVERASVQLSKAAQEHERRVEQYHESLCGLSESVMRIRAQYDAQVRYEEDMEEITAIVERIKESKLEESFEKFGKNLRKLLEILRNRKEE